jgi:hypothetical protein
MRSAAPWNVCRSFSTGPGKGRLSFVLNCADIFPVTDLNSQHFQLALGRQRWDRPWRLNPSYQDHAERGPKRPLFCATLPSTKALMAKPTFALGWYGLCGGVLVRVLRGMLGIYHVTSGSLGRFDAGFKLLSAAGTGFEPTWLIVHLPPLDPHWPRCAVGTFRILFTTIMRKRCADLIRVSCSTEG